MGERDLVHRRVMRPTLVQMALLLALSVSCCSAQSNPDSPFTDVLNTLVNEVLGVQQFQVTYMLMVHSYIHAVIVLQTSGTIYHPILCYLLLQKMLVIRTCRFYDVIVDVQFQAFECT